MQLLRTYRDDLPALGDDELAVLRARLERQMTATPVRRRARARARGGIAFGLLGTAAAACVVVGVVTAGPAPQASAAATRLLEGAASSARAGGGGGAGTTLVVREDALAMESGTGKGIEAAYVDRSVSRLRIPAGRGAWTRTRYDLPVTTFYGGAAARAFALQDRAGAPTEQDPVVERSADGSFTVGELGGRDEDVFGADVQELRRLPDDPAQLLQTFRSADLGAGAPADEAEHVMAAASLVLESGVADADLQAATFRALQQQPGLTVTDRSTDLDGRSGVAIGVPAAKERTETLQLILDGSTGRYLGHRQVTLVAIGVVPAGSVLSSTAVEQQ